VCLYVCSVFLRVTKAMSSGIYHIRLDDFELQAERVLDSSLRMRPIAIISSHHQGGTIVALSSEAKEEGLYRGLKVSIARRMSHGVTLLPYNSTLYATLHRYLYQLISHYSPIAEPAAFGQYYLDMSGMQNIYRDDIQTGYLIAKDIRGRMSMSSQIGISANKLVSSISTAVVPEVIHRVEQGSEPRFLAPLYSEILPVAQEKSVSRMLKFLFLYRVENVQTVANWPESGRTLFGSHYHKLAMEANGRDNSAVQPPQLQDHIIEQTVLAEDTNDEDILIATVRNLAEQVAYELRRRCRIAKSLRLEIHYTDGFKNSRQGAVIYNDDKTVITEAVMLLMHANYRRNRVRSILLDATRLEPVKQQLELFKDKRPDVLSQTLDRIRGKYGFGSIGSAAGLLIPKREEKNLTRSYPEDSRRTTEIFNVFNNNSRCNSVFALCSSV
jgi:DNA polymerase-4